jgi:hypothetical protein
VSAEERVRIVHQLSELVTVAVVAAAGIREDLDRGDMPGARATVADLEDSLRGASELFTKLRRVI